MLQVLIAELKKTFGEQHNEFNTLSGRYSGKENFDLSALKNFLREFNLFIQQEKNPEIKVKVDILYKLALSGYQLANFQRQQAQMAMATAAAAPSMFSVAKSGVTQFRSRNTHQAEAISDKQQFQTAVDQAIMNRKYLLKICNETFDTLSADRDARVRDFIPQVEKFAIKLILIPGLTVDAIFTPHQELWKAEPATNPVQQLATKIAELLNKNKGKFQELSSTALIMENPEKYIRAAVKLTNNSNENLLSIISAVLGSKPSPSLGR